MQGATPLCPLLPLLYFIIFLDLLGKKARDFSLLRLFPLIWTCEFLGKVLIVPFISGACGGFCEGVEEG